MTRRAWHEQIVAALIGWEAVKRRGSQAAGSSPHEARSECPESPAERWPQTRWWSCPRRNTRSRSLRMSVSLRRSSFRRAEYSVLAPLKDLVVNVEQSSRIRFVRSDRERLAFSVFDRRCILHGKPAILPERKHCLASPTTGTFPLLCGRQSVSGPIEKVGSHRHSVCVFSAVVRVIAPLVFRDALLLAQRIAILRRVVPRNAGHRLIHRRRNVRIASVISRHHSKPGERDRLGSDRETPSMRRFDLSLFEPNRNGSPFGITTIVSPSRLTYQRRFPSTFPVAISFSIVAAVSSSSQRRSKLSVAP